MVNAIESHSRELNQVDTDPDGYHSSETTEGDSSKGEAQRGGQTGGESRNGLPHNRSHMNERTGASRSKSYRSQPPASLQQQSRGSQPPFSLAGSNPYYAPPPQHGAYISPDYESLNPQYGQQSQDEGPVWSLAQPLPHVVRDGMRYGALPEDRKEEKEQQARGRPPPAADEPPTDTPEPAEARGFFNTWCKIRHYLREPLAEWLGTTVAITLGLCATLSLYTSQGQAGSWASQSAAWGFSFMIGIYVAGGISGAHLNPAITISLSLWRGFPARRCAIYILAQIIGGITAGGFAYAIYHDAIMSLSAQTNLPQNQSAASEALITLPKSFVSPATAFFNEFLGSAILVGTIMALGDDSNAPPGAGMQSFIIGIIITVIILALGYNSGGAFNGPRDFGPRLVAVMAGWGGHLFKEYHAWWIWGPWVADISGGLCGAFIYDLAIFTGGESPINYPPRRRKRALLIKEKNLLSKFRLGRRKIGDIERAVEETQD